MLFRRDIPLHAFRWVRRLYAARSYGKGMIIEAFRGSSKITSISIAFLAFRVGLSPHDSFLVLQATATAARATCRQVADLITHNPGWHVAFPHVLRDKECGFRHCEAAVSRRGNLVVFISKWRWPRKDEPTNDLIVNTLRLDTEH